MAVIVDLTTFQEFSGHTPDYEGQPEKYLVYTRENIQEWETFKAQGIDRKFWKVEDGAIVAMSQQEQDALTTAELSAYKQATKKTLTDKCNAFIQSKYTLENQQTISYLMDMAERENKTNRFNYFNQVGIWATTILGYFYYYQELMLSKTSIAEINALIASMSFAQFEASDPDVIIRVGVAIPD